MSKFSIYLLALLSFYCYGIQIFKPTDSSGEINEKNVKLGEEFVVEFIVDFELLKFFDYDKISDSIQFLRREVTHLKSPNFANPTFRNKISLYFKAIKVTNEAKILKFLYKNQKMKYYKIKINVY